MEKLHDNIISIVKKYLKCDKSFCNNYGTRRLHHKGTYCKKCYQKILDSYFKTEWGSEIGGGGGTEVMYYYN
jgi:hypothetical protein